MNSKQTIKKTLKSFKKVINSNPKTKSIAVSVKRVLVKALGTNDPRELYNLSSFYPSIRDYYFQLKDSEMSNGPLISILLPTYNTPEEYLRECIDSIIIQSYSNWELCISDDNSSDKNVTKIIKEYQKQDSRIKLIVRKVNGHISEATNSALGIANGEYIALMDHDDVLWPNALYEMVKVIKAGGQVDFVYSDEDKIDGTGKTHSYPFLKPEFSPEFLESCNYITHFSCIRKSVMDEVGGFRKGYEGAQDWDLFLRISEITPHIIHIPKILYSWRIHEASTASNTDAKPYVYEAQRKLLVDHIERTGMSGSVETGIITQHRTIKYDIDTLKQLAVIIRVSSVEGAKKVLESMVEHEAGMNYTVILATSTAISTIQMQQFKDLNKNVNMNKILRISKKTNIYQAAVNEIDEEYVVFIDSSVEVASDDWAKLFVADTQREGVGIVGPVLLDKTKQIIVSAGLGIGYGGNGYVDMLQGMPFDDPHYSRGLYAKSRRNVSAVNEKVFAIKAQILAELLKSLKSRGHESLSVVDISSELLEKGLRNIYTPYIQFTKATQDTKKVDEILGVVSEDPYLNPNFNHDNGRMEVKA